MKESQNPPDIVIKIKEEVSSCDLSSASVNGLKKKDLNDESKEKTKKFTEIQGEIKKDMKDEILDNVDVKMEQDDAPADAVVDKKSDDVCDSDSVKPVAVSEISSDNINGKRKRRLSRTSRRSRKMRRLMASNPTPETHLVNDTESNMSNSENEDEYCLNVFNLPKAWSNIQIKNYICTECGPVDDIEFVQVKDKNVPGSVKLYFQNKDKCDKAKAALENKVVEGQNLFIKIEVSSEDSDSDDLSDTTEVLDSTRIPWRPDDIWDEDPAGLYGLKPEFLRTLNITPPITKWVCVSNFRCDKTELRDVLEMAGHVLMCAVFTVVGKSARVMYSHPLEAVQAISMLHGQVFYGKKLSVVMDRVGNANAMLPKGLLNIGVGLGINGQPLRNILRDYKRYLQDKTSCINPLLFTSKDAATSSTNLSAEGRILRDKVKDMESQINSQIQSLKVNHVEDASNFSVVVNKDDSDSDGSQSEVRSKEIKPLVGSVRRQPVSTFHQSVIRQNVPLVTQSLGTNASVVNGVPRMSLHKQPEPPGVGELRRVIPSPVVGGRGARGPVGPMPGPAPFAPAVGPAPRAPPEPFQSRALRPLPNQAIAPGSLPGPRPFGPQSLPNPNPNAATVRLCNLPLNTTFSYLFEQLAKCGQVVSLQFTTPGCAVATFAHRAHAEKCFQIYNRLVVENCIIGVQII